MTGRIRADQLLVQRGLMESRAKARAAIEAGRVEADGAPVRSPSDLLSIDCALSAEPAFAWVSRGGLKLAFALDRFGVDPKGRVCVDLGASTGGFAHVLLERGARRVFCIDVGRDQLHPRLKADPRIVNLERTDARNLDRGRILDPFDLITCDLSFISLAKALAPGLALAQPPADLIALVKPQFEAGPDAIGKGGKVRADALFPAAQAAAEAIEAISGFCVRELVESPILGGDGAREFLLHAQSVSRP